MSRRIYERVTPTLSERRVVDGDVVMRVVVRTPPRTVRAMAALLGLLADPDLWRGGVPMVGLTPATLPVSNSEIGTPLPAVDVRPASADTAP